MPQPGTVMRPRLARRCLMAVGGLLAVLPTLGAAAPAAATDGGEVHAQVVGGTPVPDGKYPFVVFILNSFTGSSGAVCTGSVIDPQWVLTAAHCTGNQNDTAFSSPSSFKVGWGTANSHTMNVTAV